jgi:hypothetical protein
VQEILKNIEPQKSTEWNYEEYEESSDKINEEIMQKVKVYDKDLPYVQVLIKMIQGPEQEGPPSALNDTIEIDSEDDDDQRTEASEEPGSADKSSSEVKATESQQQLTNSRFEALISLYKEKMRKVEQQLDDEFSKYLRCPWSYPHFETEWRSFYVEKSHHLAGLSQIMSLPINYLPAWFDFWPGRMREIKLKKLNVARQQLRKELRVPDDFEDSDDYETPKKRMKFNNEVAAIPSYHPSDPVMTTKPSEIDRIVFIYNVAYENFMQGKRLSPLEIVEAVNANFKPRQEPAHSGQTILNDNDLLMLFDNFSNLNDHEQVNFLNLLRCIELSDPIRYADLKRAMKKN